MKRLVVMLILMNLGAYVGYAQVFEGVELKKKSLSLKKYLKELDSYGLYDFKLKELSSFAQSKGDKAFNMHLKLSEKFNYQLQLSNYDLRSSDYVLRVEKKEGVVEYPKSRSITFYGILKGQPNSVVLATVSDNFMSLVIRPENGENIQITTLSNPKKTGYQRPIVLAFKSSDFKSKREAVCGVKERNDRLWKGNLGSVVQKKPEAATAVQCRSVRLSQGISKRAHEEWGANAALTEAKAITILAITNQSYLPTGIKHVLVETYIAESATPATINLSNMGNYLNSWLSWANNGGFKNPTDIRSFWVTSEGSYGYAWDGVVCEENGGHINPAWADYDDVGKSNLQAHESGHNWSSGHSSGIMAPTVPFVASQFIAGSLAKINSYAENNGSCLQACVTTPPVVDFTSNRQNIEATMSIQFEDLTDFTYSVTKWEWIFPGGQPASFVGQIPPVVIYNTPGKYAATLKATNAFGTTEETKPDYIDVRPQGPPVVDFSSDLIEVDLGGSVIFTDLSVSSNTITSWEWTFEGGQPSTFSGKTPPPIKYDEVGGPYKVSLKAINVLGTAEEVKEKYITVLLPPAPVANFLSSFTEIDAGQKITFIDVSSSKYPITSWEWTFEGGQPSTFSGKKPPDIVYPEEGVYTVKLVVSNPGDEAEVEKIEYIIVNKSFEKAVPDFSADVTTIQSGETVNFTDLTISESPITDYAWSFEGAFPTFWTDATPTAITYNTAGTYKVSLTITTGAGDSTVTKETYIIVTDEPVDAPTAEFSGAPLIIDPGQTVTFIDASSSPSSAISSWNWSFPGGVPSSFSGETPPAIQYNSSGKYSVSLLVVDGNGNASEAKSGYIIVNTVPIPMADFSGDKTTVTEGETVSFTDISTSETTIVSWMWLFEGGDIANSTDQNPSVQYDVPGTYRVTLIVTNIGGSSTITKSGYIEVVKNIVLPTVDFEANAISVSTGTGVTFTDLSTSDLPITGWFWTFEGGFPSIFRGQQPIDIVYSTSGVYEVTLRVTNEDGSQTEIKKEYIEVTAERTPKANFIADLTGIVPNGIVSFTDLSTSPSEIIAWEWMFEGGNPALSTDQNPIGIQYADIGSYNVQLKVTNSDGSSELIRDQYIQVQSSLIDFPKANFQSSADTVEIGQTVIFSDASTSVSPISSWEWLFPGGVPSSYSGETPPPIIYSSPGDYTVILTIENETGQDTGLKNKVIIVIENNDRLPIAKFSADQIAVKQEEAVLFTDQSTSDVAISSWEWTFQGGFPATYSGQNPPSVVYSMSGKYDVKLIVTNAFGNATEIEIEYITVVVKDATDPTAAFTAFTKSIEKGSCARFIDESTAPVADPIQVWI